jgi:hypothetical protein
MNFHFCQLRKYLSSTSYQIQWSYLPEKYAKVGKVLVLKDEGDGWEVIYAGPPKCREEAMALSNDWCRQREVSDV